ncbi:MAG: DUF3102 domain-containing protein, partial [Selenomonadaceae bacterium]|nr:DUF3102 domain-containing protein [Selenomonadaceae bacterium]
MFFEFSALRRIICPAVTKTRSLLGYGVNRNCKFHLHGEWQNWLDDNFGLKYRMAANFMAVAERFGNVHSNAHLNQTQMIQMLVLPEGE